MSLEHIMSAAAQCGAAQQSSLANILYCDNMMSNGAGLV